MFGRKALSKGSRLRHCNLEFAAAFSKVGYVAPSAVRNTSQHNAHQQAMNFSSGKNVPESSSSSKSESSIGSGGDYLSLFQPSSGSSIAPYTPGNVLKVYPLPRYVLKEDIVRHVEGSNIKPENVKFVYSTAFRPDYVQISVDSPSTQKQAMKYLQERGRLGFRLLRLETSQPMPWTVVDAALKDSPRGRTILMFNVNLSTDFEDVERFFTGYNYDSSYVRFIRVNTESNRARIGRQQVLHVAVGFKTKLEALRAMREKMGDFCVNRAISLRLIQ
ncbi:hypothetical protein KP509_26G067300 [Ceratopteris richardii]|uniref:Uncharacterized protein n=1 Tax=Ceratopteris richardii TaxID=49495 RepID=A0A8T2RPF4_CERRI|nr:hypothetical protein KP509_26G067300 [Ceratopteris richardii]KAH7297388.1 hypothetical protein KP509_26G067300 [Ceratopteris richardii]KAH7297389.1 hypothetical protein KP509_26G067300 [Ceratopteris richardii]KAH7297390.1 hypothetical protein KP509_26G067300 [Ceratopteris richardii]